MNGIKLHTMCTMRKQVMMKQQKVRQKLYLCKHLLAKLPSANQLANFQDQSLGAVVLEGNLKKMYRLEVKAQGDEMIE